MKKSFFFALLAVLALTVTSCSATLQSMREPVVRFELNSSDYTLSEPVTGEATVTKVFNIDWSRLFNKKAGSVGTPIIGLTTAGIPSMDIQYAVFDLMEKNPGYDFVMYPQVVVVTNGVPFLYENSTIKVTARLGKLKRK